MASMSGGQDRRAFPQFYADYDTATGLGKRLSYRVVVNEPISYSGQGQVGRDIKNITAGLTIERQYPTLAGFLPVVAPASALPGAKIEHYKNEEAYLFALAEALHQEYRAIVDAGPLRADRRCFPALYARAHGAADVEFAVSALGADAR